MHCACILLYGVSMKYGCPNSDCLFYGKTHRIVCDGSYIRANDSRKISRFRCMHCKRRFSLATFSLAKNQKKRRINIPLHALLVSGVSMRRAAFILKINIHTVERRIHYFAKKAEIAHAQFLIRLKSNPVLKIQFDDLITSEHTKMKPVTVSLAVDAKTRAILSAQVGKIPAFGHLAESSRKKYGKRDCEHVKTLTRMFTEIENIVSPQTEFCSDEHPHYPEVLRRFFKDARHKRYKGGRGCVAGQGELKKKSYDPLFVLNHSCATLRANINRLERKTWCTTKSVQMLKKHIDIFINFYNHQYLKV